VTQTRIAGFGETLLPVDRAIDEADTFLGENEELARRPEFRASARLRSATISTGTRGRSQGNRAGGRHMSTLQWRRIA
jgi:hypothetical protein